MNFNAHLLVISVQNPCGDDRGGCSHFCLLSSIAAERYKCGCPDGMELVNDTYCGRKFGLIIIIARFRLNPHTNTQRLRTSYLHGTQATFNEYTWMVLCIELYAVVDIHTPWILTIGMWKIHRKLHELLRQNACMFDYTQERLHVLVRYKLRQNIPSSARWWWNCYFSQFWTINYM